MSRTKATLKAQTCPLEANKVSSRWNNGGVRPWEKSITIMLRLLFTGEDYMYYLWFNTVHTQVHTRIYMVHVHVHRHTHTHRHRHAKVGISALH